AVLLAVGGGDLRVARTRDERQEEEGAGDGRARHAENHSNSELCTNHPTSSFRHVDFVAFAGYARRSAFTCRAVTPGTARSVASSAALIALRLPRCVRSCCLV